MQRKKRPLRLLSFAGSLLFFLVSCNSSGDTTSLDEKTQTVIK